MLHSGELHLIYAFELLRLTALSVLNSELHKAYTPICWLSGAYLLELGLPFSVRGKYTHILSEILKLYTDNIKFDWSIVQAPSLASAIALLKASENSVPGVDGIPFAAWRAGGEIAHKLLFEMLLSHMSGSPTRLHFNIGLWLFPPQETVAGRSG